MTPSPSVVTIGVFDGFHRGHVLVLARARQWADRTRSRLAVFTFDRHPRTVLGGEGSPERLISSSAKIDLLRQAGAEEIRVVRFS